MPGPVLFCYDGSEGSRDALRAGGELVARLAEGFVLTVWQPVSARLLIAGTFAPAVPTGDRDIDEEERLYAQSVAEEGAKLGRDHGYDLTPLVERAGVSIARAIIETAERLDASVIVCGQRGRGAIRAALLGSVSRELIGHAGRPILLTPEKKQS